MSPAALPTLAARTPPSDGAAESLLRQLVEIQSLSGNESACAQALLSSMQVLGFDAFIDQSGSAVGVIGDPSPTAREIILLGHIDTVPGEIPVRQEGDLLYGRGTVDAKGPLAAFVMAAAHATLPPNSRVRVIGAVEEESASSKGARFAASVYRPAACIIGEPSSVDGITLGYKGRLIANVTVSTDSSHSAGPDATAPECAFELWSRVRAAATAFRAEAPRVFDRVQARLRNIRSETDGLNDRATLTLGFRIPPGVAPAELEALCLRAGDSLRAKAEWSFTGHEAAHVADRSNPVARVLTGAIRSEGLSPHPKLKTGTSDMNVVGPIWNCPIAAYGPGDSSLDHTPSEHIAISEYLTSIRVLRCALEHLANELTGA